MRGLSRTLLAKVFAAFLALLAASPLTAPFTTCGWSDLVNDRPVDHTPPGEPPHAAVTELKAPADLNTTVFTSMVTTAALSFDRHRHANPLPVDPHRTPIHVRVLRI